MVRNEEQCLRVLELYGGIGGMRFGLEDFFSQTDKCTDKDVGTVFASISVKAVDISPHAKAVYDLNFPGEHLKNIDVRALKDEDFDVWLLTMSPPCQPFTRNGNVRDVSDFRCESFLHILERLKRLDRIPQQILMENVQGFETSDAHLRFVSVLNKRGYRFKEYLLNPVDFGYPNSRLRYYLAAKRICPIDTSPTPDSSGCQPSIELSLKSAHGFTSRGTLRHYLLDRQDVGNTEVDRMGFFKVPIEITLRYLMVMDIKHPESDTTNCFTSNYGRFLKGAGSIFCPLSKQEFDLVCQKFQETEFVDEKRTCIASMKLRYFTPFEVALLMGFPDHFRFPSSMSNKICWRLVGNSLNVKIISAVLKNFLLPAEPSDKNELSKKITIKIGF